MNCCGNEILTLAFGHYSCHLATNFYNIQEASFSYNPNFSSGINHDFCFRENRRRSDSYCPRLILVDDDDSLGYLSQDGYYKENVERPINAAEEVIYKEPKWEPNEYVVDILKEKQRIKSGSGPCQDYLLKSSYNLDDCVVSWSDYVTAELDENTFLSLPKQTEYYDNYSSFTCFDSGHSLWNSTYLGNDIEEKVRFFLEESDNLQGFQVLTDGGNGYSGISSCCVELLRDEYAKKVILSVPSIYVDLELSEDVRVSYKKKCDRLYSLASSFSRFSEFCDLVTPMSHIYNPWSKDPRVRLFRNMNYKHNMMYHTSAILAAGFDLFTLPYRLKAESSTMNNLVSAINIYGRCFATIGVNMPISVNKSMEQFPSPDEISGKVFESLTPMIDVNPNCIDIQSVTSKGVGRNETNGMDKEDHLKNFRIYLQQIFPRVFTQISVCTSAFRVPRTYPKVFDSNFNLALMNNDFGPLSEYVTIGGLHNSREMLLLLTNLYDETKAIKKKAVPGFRPRDSDVDYEGMLEGLKIVSESYLERMPL